MRKATCPLRPSDRALAREVKSLKKQLMELQEKHETPQAVEIKPVYISPLQQAEMQAREMIRYKKMSEAAKVKEKPQCTQKKIDKVKPLI